ncbi:hypothetical protein CC78DRAFT_533359 [Lojkania enalia]|uniref:NACHT domain-containing protein n=1 Tax=Lojkania enalia TaxID=147567 RepID=A0A9P4N442_9PLEO|nr:hypothetical protein CC78DRAFT_533359 [Didymosphaeria enalia]
MAPNAFTVALERFISNIEHEEDKKSQFYKEVLVHLHDKTIGKTLAEESNRSAAQLQMFIQQLESKQRQSSKTLKVTDRLRPLVSGLSQYTASCDVIVQAAPSAAVLLYGGARVVLQLAEKFFSCFDTIISMLERIGDLLQCYQGWSNAYKDSFEFQERLVKTYKNIIYFWLEASKFYNKKPYKTFFKGFLKPLDAEWQKCRQALEDDARAVQMLAQVTEAKMSRQQETEKAERQQSKAEIAKRKEIVEWIRGCEDEDSLDVREDIEDLIEKRHKDTCNWIFRHPDMEDWLNAKDSRAIWYTAGPGAGKTVMSSAVTRHIQSVQDSEGKPYKTAVFLCSFNDISRRKAITVFRSLALQLLRPKDRIPDKVHELFEDDLDNNRSRLSDDRLRTATEVVGSLLKTHARIHVIIDGLDECENKEKLLEALSRLFRILSTKTYNTIKFFFTSRDEPDIRYMMRENGVKEITASEKALMQDVRAYLAPRMHCDKCTEHWLLKSEGNFMWMSLMLPIIMGEITTCEGEIGEKIDEFPKGLTGCYARSLSRLSRQPESSQELARKIFTMVVGAVQPLRLSELRHAIAATKALVDYTPQWLPKADVIERLCCNLIVFDRRGKGHDVDPYLKVAHKSIQDFFQEDPDTLELTDNKVRKYFVLASEANLMLGQSSLSYLRYLRYNQPRDVDTILDDDNHSFLKHAATFWHRYLSAAPHSKDLHDQVVDFARSEAFWTCIAVQSRVAPHLFGWYMKTKSGGFKLITTGLKEERDEDSVNFSIPLPEWLDFEQYGQAGARVVEALHSFVSEWHAVLNSQPFNGDQCTMGHEWTKYMQGKAAWESDRVKCFILSQEEGSSKTSPLSYVGINVDSGNLVGTVLEYEESTGRYLTRKLPISAASPYAPSSWTAEPATPFLATHSTNSFILTKLSDLENEYWLIESQRLCVQHHRVRPGLGIETFTPPEKINGKWHLLHGDPDEMNDELDSDQDIAAFHYAEDRPVTADNVSTQESGYGSIDHDSEIESEPEEDDDREPVSNYATLIIRNGQKPAWRLWKSAIPKLEAPYAFHPTEPLAAWSPSAHECFIWNVASGKEEHLILPEPADIEFSSVFAARKEFHFSESGDSIHYLLCAASETEHGIRYSISLSSFLFPSALNAESVFERTHPTANVTYECTGSVQHPLVITLWASDCVYIVLPRLSCKPKIIRMCLTANPDPTSSPMAARVQTLREPIFFPYSTPYRNPRLNLFPKGLSKESLLLILDAEFSQNQVLRKPPAVYIWNIDSEKDWRAWDKGVDAQTREVMDYECTYAMLRGTFVTGENRFEVPVRSGLDWRRKAFLSCA